MVLFALLSLALTVQPPCVAVHGGALNVQGDSSAVAIAAALQRRGYVEQANCVLAMVERREKSVGIWLVLIETQYRPALIALGGGTTFEAAVETAAIKLSEQVSFWQPCWDSHAPRNIRSRVFSDQQYSTLCGLIAESLRP